MISIHRSSHNFSAGRRQRQDRSAVACLGAMGGTLLRITLSTAGPHRYFGVSAGTSPYIVALARNRFNPLPPGPEQGSQPTCSSRRRICSPDQSIRYHLTSCHQKAAAKVQLSRIWTGILARGGARCSGSCIAYSTANGAIRVFACTILKSTGRMVTKGGKESDKRNDSSGQVDER